MLEGLKFNQDIDKYRMENPTQLLLYNVKDGQIFLAQGNTKDFLLNIINNQPKEMQLENKYINFLKNNNILEEL